MKSLRQDWNEHHRLVPREYGTDIEIDKSSWKNYDTPSFLHAIETCIAESQRLPANFPYGELARILSASRTNQGRKVNSRMLSDKRLNCWEVMECGREPGGKHAEELGVCPACTWEVTRDANGGVNGGRICWQLVGTLCGGDVQGRFAEKIDTCSICRFYQYVRRQEGNDFRYPLPDDP